MAGSSPGAARLHHPSSAWCFSSSALEAAGEETAVLEILLPSATLVSGVQSQGPPTALHAASYMRYISLTVEVWRDGWRDCCSGGSGATHFYADDTAAEAGAVATHSFGRLVAASRLRVSVSAALRWIGEDSKCFRFEVLGCGAGAAGRSGLQGTPEAPGYLALSWHQPSVLDLPNHTIPYHTIPFHSILTHNIP